MPSLENYVQKIHKKLNNEGLETRKVKKYLQELDRLQITLDVLKATGIGRAVNRYRKHGSEIGDLASSLVTKWKELLKKDPGPSHKYPSSNDSCKGIFHLSSNHSDYSQRESVSESSRSEVKIDHSQLKIKHDKSEYRTGELRAKIDGPSESDDIDMDCVDNKQGEFQHKMGKIKAKTHRQSASEVKIDVNNKHVKLKHKTAEVRANNVNGQCASDEEANTVDVNNKDMELKHKIAEVKAKIKGETASDELKMDHVNSEHLKSEERIAGVKWNVKPSSLSEVEMDHVIVKSKNKTGENKSKARSAPQLCDVSFGCEPVNVKQKKRPTTSASAAMATKMTFSDSVRPDLELPPLPSSLSVKNSLLPEIQPTYRPLRMSGFGEVSPKKKKGVVSGELDEHALMSRKSRTQVFSGRKIATSSGVVTSLFELCIRVLMENVDALGDTGGVPYDILQPVLEKCSPQQLFQLEECNPYFIDDTEPLWEKHCCREFKGTKPDRGQTWRELYMKNEEDREARLKRINEKITASQKAKKPERQVKLAYVETVAKPPPAIRRKQAKFGTGTGVHHSGPVETPSRIMSQAHHRNVGSSPAKKQAVPAPMMKKTMKLFKNQRSRAATSIRRT